METMDSISDVKKKYIEEELNPLLELLVRSCLAKEPEDPVPFMLQILEEKKIETEDAEMSEDEKAAIERENNALAGQMKRVKSHMASAAKLVIEEEASTRKVSDAFPESDEEEEESDDDEPPPGFFKDDDDVPTMRARTSVSAEAYGDWNQKKRFTAPVIPKSDEQKDRLREVLSKSFMFSNLDDADLVAVIGAMKEKSAETGEVVIRQGEAGNFLFVVETGTLDCLIKSKDGDDEKVVKTCTTGDVVGELALLYNAPRAATVKATGACALWELDRDTFTNLVRDAAQKKRDRYDKFLSGVPLLEDMDMYERGQLADALKTETFDEGTEIVKVGDVGSKFYIMEEGQAEAQKNGQTVMKYKSGDYFGELALIRNQPRAATVQAKGSVKCLSLDSGSFKRLLNVNALLERAIMYD